MNSARELKHGKSAFGTEHVFSQHNEFEAVRNSEIVKTSVVYGRLGTAAGKGGNSTQRKTNRRDKRVQREQEEERARKAKQKRKEKEKERERKG
ncbi:unnamed protein product [Xylocopa violacea]|uniref:Uncharacterized protein n=1 Tax=Xylocopa violacea TaxID=135666 RepID=A0ABP1N7J1_XYLVO